MIRIGIIHEGKIPPDKRVPLTPNQCKILEERYSNLEILIQPSSIRAFKNIEYKEVGIKLSKDLNSCDILLGIKEVSLDMLIQKKTYMFFSHTYKKQPCNHKLLRTILDKKIRLIDYEMLKKENGKRLLGFGRYAGIVGCYNAFRAWGELIGEYQLKPAHQCYDREEMEGELVKVKLPKHLKIVLTGTGRAASGAMEILSVLPIVQVLPKEYLKHDFSKPVFTQLNAHQYFKREDGQKFTRREFYQNPKGFVSDFMRYARLTDIYISSHFWSDKSPYIFTRKDTQSLDFKIKLISDISCDIDGPIASTIRPSTIEDPFYAYNPQTEKEVILGTFGSIGVSAVDNLPCELPRNASEDFGNELVKNVIPQFFNGDEGKILERASETDYKGQLTPIFSYLKDYAEG